MPASAPQQAWGESLVGHLIELFFFCCSGGLALGQISIGPVTQMCYSRFSVLFPIRHNLSFPSEQKN